METAAEGAAGSVGVASEGLATCSEAAYCSKARSTIVSYLGGSWTWATPCSYDIWQATGSGGRTLTAVRGGNPGGLYERRVSASQQSAFWTICSCGVQGNVSCSNNPEF